MKRDIAERIAACAGDGVPLDQARSVIREYVAALATCSICDGSGEFTVMRDVPLSVIDRSKRTIERIILQGERVRCPHCGGDGGLEGKDPEFVGWHCVMGAPTGNCQNSQQGDDHAKASHARCGYRVMLPLDADLLPTRPA